MSCYHSSGAETLSTLVNDADNNWDPSLWNSDPSEYTQEMISHKVTVYGTFNSTQQNGSLTPVWNLTSIGTDEKSTNAIIYGQTTNTIPSPKGRNVNWMEYTVTTSGGWANTIYGVDTVGDQPLTTVSSSRLLCQPCSVNVLLAVHPWHF